MVKTIINFFTYHKPEFVRFRAEDVVMEGKAYFLFSWQVENTYRLKIPGLKYSTWKSSGSAYVLIPDEVDTVEVIAVTFWRSTQMGFKIKRTSVNAPVDFEPIVLPPELHAGSMYLPELILNFKTPALKQRLAGVKIPEFKLNQP